MASQLVGHATHFAPAHGVWLPGDGERSHAGFTYSASYQMTVNNSVALVCTTLRLVNTLGKHSNHPFGAGKPVIELFQFFVADSRSSGNTGLRATRNLNTRIKTTGVARHKITIDPLGRHKIIQQAHKQISVTAWRKIQM